MREQTSTLEILLVEDNPGDAKLIERYLDRADSSILGEEVELTHVESLDAFFDVYDTQQFDIILLDLGLPESSGLETLTAVLDHNPVEPIVVLTGLDDLGTSVRAIKTGAQDYLTKENLNEKLLVRAIRNAIEHRRYELELIEREDLISVLNRVLRHNLRNDLTVVLGHIEFIRERNPKDTESIESIQIIEDTVRDLLELSEKARTFEQITNQELEHEESNLKTVIGEAIEDIQNRHPATAVQIEETPDETVIVSSELGIAIREILDNAAVHAGEDPEIVVSSSVTDEHVIVEITDDGPGLPELEQYTFDEGKETPLEHGQGLGLRLIDWIMTRHQGNSTVSVANSGTTFTLTLPKGAAVPWEIESTFNSNV